MTMSVGARCCKACHLFEWSVLCLFAIFLLICKVCVYSEIRNGIQKQNRRIGGPRVRSGQESAELEWFGHCGSEKLGRATNFSSRSPRCHRGTEVYENDKLYEYSQKPRHSAFSASNLELYLRLYAGRLGDVRSSLLPSLQLFWPAAHVVAVMDSESDAALAGRLPGDIAKEFPPLCVRTKLLADYKEKPWPNWTGYDRQRLDMLYADEIVKAKYVGFVDTDTFFVAPIEPQDIFTDDGRPIVQGSITRINLEDVPQTDLWWRTLLAAEFFLKKPQAMNCMSYFPVVFATKHIREMRQYVERIHGRPFLETVKALSKQPGIVAQSLCHYTLMCNYVWHFKRSEYAFYFSNVHDYKPGWDKPMRGQVSDFSFLKQHRTAPFVRMSTHFSYVYFGELANKSDGYGVNTLPKVGHLKDKFNGEAAAVPTLRCYCHVALVHCQKEAMPDCPRIIEKCSANNVTREKLNFFLFRFEQGEFSVNVQYMQTREFDPRAIHSQRWYYESLRTAREWLIYAKSIIKAKRCTVAKLLF